MHTSIIVSKVQLFALDIWLFCVGCFQTLDLNILVVYSRVVRLFLLFLLSFLVDSVYNLICTVKNPAGRGAASKALRRFGVPFYRTCGTEVMTTTSHNWISIMFPTNEAGKRNVLIRVVAIRFIFHLLLGSFSQLIKLPTCQV